MIPRKTSVLFVLVVALVAFGCQSIRMNNRKPVEGSPDMVVSQFAPEDFEQCTEVGQAKCPYWNNPFKTVQSACSEQKAPEARDLGANYIRVDEPNSSVGGFKTSSPIAHYYHCAKLDKS